MKSKIEILNEIANDPSYYEVCKNISKTQGVYTKLNKDLYQECMLILLEMPEDKIFHLYNRQELKPMFIRIVKNQWSSGGREVKGYSPFYKKFRRENQVQCVHGGLFDEKFNFDFAHHGRDEFDFTTHKLGIEEIKETSTSIYEIEQLNKEVREIINAMYFFDKYILLIYLGEHKPYIEGKWTLSTLSKELGIGRNKINDSIQNAKKHIREQLKIKKEKKNIW